MTNCNRRLRSDRPLCTLRTSIDPLLPSRTIYNPKHTTKTPNMLVVRLAAFILQICLMDASLLFRSNKRLEIPALKIFTNADMESLLLQLEEPKVLTFKGISPKAFYNFEKEFNLTYSAYVPKEDLNIDTFLLGE